MGTGPHRWNNGTLDEQELLRLDAYWRAANYLSVGQIYLLDNPLLREPLRPEHIKPRLLGHWGTTPGLNFIYAHLNRVIRARDLNVIYVCGPGHGGPGMVANTYLEGTYSEIYPNVGQDVDGLRRLFRQFSFPGGIPSHAAPETPGSIHEGGELGYALAHAYGAAFDNPDLIVACVVGDGEAETGALAASWHSNKFLNPGTDGAVLPILHLNGYKIANPTILGRMPDDDLMSLFRGFGYDPVRVEGSDPLPMHQRMAAAFDEAVDAIHAIQQAARAGNAGERGRRCRAGRSSFCARRRVGPDRRRSTARRSRASGALTRCRSIRPARIRSTCACWRSGCAATGPTRCSTTPDGSFRSLPQLAPTGDRRMGANPHANGGLLKRELRLPDYRTFAVDVPAPETRMPRQRVSRERSCATSSG